MGDSWQKSVVLITSRADGNSVYGTGFVVHRDERGTYVLTCTHVVDDVSGEEWVNVNDLPAMVIASGPADGVDVAVLRVAGLANEPLLRPYIVDSGVGEAFELAGYYHLDDNPKKKLVFRSLTGKFSGTLQAGPTRDTLVPIWEIEITSNDELRPGNSGSPVVNENHDVIGIVNTRLSSNKKRGWVTPIEALEKVWPEIAPRLFERSGRREEKLNTPPTITPSVPPVQALTETPSTISSQTAVPAPQRTGKQPGDEGAAISIFEGLLEGPIVHELLKHFPPSQTLNYDMGEALEKLRHDEETSAARKQEAIDAAEEAIRQKPDDASVHYNMGNVLYQFGVYKKALDAYNQAIRLDSTFAAAHYKRAFALLNLAQPGLSRGQKILLQNDEALAAYREARSLDPHPTSINEQDIFRLKALEQLEELTAAKQAIDQNPNDAQAYCKKGDAHFKLGQYGEALDAYDQALQFDPKLLAALVGKGDVLYNLGQYAEALDAYDQALKLNPSYVSALYGKGNTLLKRGQNKEALALFDKCIQLKPSLAIAYHRKSLTLRRLKKTREADAVLKTAKKLGWVEEGDREY